MAEMFNSLSQFLTPEAIDALNQAVTALFDNVLVLQSVTMATRPDPTTVAVGYTIFVTDGGQGSGISLVSNGTNWVDGDGNIVP